MPKIRSCPFEAAEAIALMKWAALHPICSEFLIAIPNGGRRDAKEARNLQRQGVKSGVSDYFLPIPVPTQGIPQYGLWIELKRTDKKISKPTPQQLTWISKMRKRGYAAEVAYGAIDAIGIIQAYLKGQL